MKKNSVGDFIQLIMKMDNPTGMEFYFALKQSLVVLEAAHNLLNAYDSHEQLEDKMETLRKAIAMEGDE